MFKYNVNDADIQVYMRSSVKRYDIINYLISKYNLVNYLEIGVFNGETIKKIIAKHKDGVDPGVEGSLVPEVNYPITSDEFFNLIEGKNIQYDIIFIDGLHHSEQVFKDMINSWENLKDGGFIVLHDCNPLNFEMQKVPRETIAWNGDVWKALVNFKRFNKDIMCYTVDTDWGVGVIKKDNNIEPHFNVTSLAFGTWDYEYFSKNRKSLLGLISYEEFTNIF